MGVWGAWRVQGKRAWVGQRVKAKHPCRNGCFIKAHVSSARCIWPIHTQSYEQHQFLHLVSTHLSQCLQQSKCTWYVSCLCIAFECHITSLDCLPIDPHNLGWANNMDSWCCMQGQGGHRRLFAGLALGTISTIQLIMYSV